MGTLFFITGAVISGIISNFYFAKKNKSIDEELYKADQSYRQKEKAASIEIKDLERQLKMKIDELRKTRDRSDSAEDKFEDLDFEVSRLKKVNHSLIEENEKLASTVKEYEVLYKVKKDEIEKLKNLLNK